MKICPKCRKTYADDFAFCSTCGCGLEQQEIPINQNKNLSHAIIIVALIVIVCIGFALSEQKKISDTRKEIENYKYNKAFEEYMNTPTTADIKVGRDWTTEKSGNYIYIKGTVTNTSYSKTISYFEVEAKFYDRYGNVIDSDWTNDGKDLAPGESRRFEIMHRYSPDEQDIKLSIKDVK
jgi:hypothetical protein